MKPTMFCFGKFHFPLAVGDMLEQKCFWYPGFGLFGRQYYHPHPRKISDDIEIFLHSSKLLSGNASNVTASIIDTFHLNISILF